ncbi:thermonuclease family protein [Planctomycetota bacterium]
MTRYAMSRSKLRLVIALCISVAVGGVVLDRSFTSTRKQHRQFSDIQNPSHDFEKYHSRIFTVINVVDGDTIDINIPDGKYDSTRIRLWGVDTPETKHPETGVMYFGPEAAEFTKQMCLWKKVTIYLDKENTRGKYGRILAYAQLPDGKFLNEILLTQGYAYADTRFRHDFYYRYKQLESVAKSRKKGLWQQIRTEQMPMWRQ